MITKNTKYVIPILNTLLNNIGIYKITAGKESYIGSSSNLRARWAKHLSTLFAGKHDIPDLQEYFNMYGVKNLKFEVINYCLNYERKELEELEYSYIRHFKPLYNSSIDGINNPKTKLREEDVRKIRSDVRNNELIAEEFNISKKSVYEIKSLHTFSSVLNEDGTAPNKTSSQKGKNGCKMVGEFNNDNVLINCWESLTQAGKLSGVSVSTVANSVKGRSITKRIFKYI